MSVPSPLTFPAARTLPQLVPVEVVGDPYTYQPDFDNFVYSEAVHGALPLEIESQQVPPFGLLHEVISGRAFVTPHAAALWTDAYRRTPSRQNQGTETIVDDLNPRFLTAPLRGEHLPNATYITPPTPALERNFVTGISTQVANGAVDAMTGSAIHFYSFAKNMGGTEQTTQTYFKNDDGHMMLIPVEEALDVITELGRMHIEVGAIAMIPRGIKFQVNRIAGANPAQAASGYVWEVYDDGFAKNYPKLPDLGPMGTKGNANRRHFQKPVAWFEDVQATDANPLQLIRKYQGEFWQTPLLTSPFDVVAFAGNYTPWKFNMRRFQTINSVSYGHVDPSVFTALTSPAGDFVIFNGDIWWTAEGTFRPPFFHTNVGMHEAMGTVAGNYEAKPVKKGGLTVHNGGTPHGPDTASVVRGRGTNTSTPVRSVPSIVFMLETALGPWRSSPFAVIDPKYIANSWSGFTPIADLSALVLAATEKP